MRLLPAVADSLQEMACHGVEWRRWGSKGVKGGQGWSRVVKGGQGGVIMFGPFFVTLLESEV